MPILAVVWRRSENFRRKREGVWRRFYFCNREYQGGTMRGLKARAEDAALSGSPLSLGTHALRRGLKKDVAPLGLCCPLAAIDQGESL
jgi:hypothetical protein